jgi:hypothetical protein
MLETRFYVSIMAGNSLCSIAEPYIDVGITHHFTTVHGWLYCEDLPAPLGSKDGYRNWSLSAISKHRPITLTPLDGADYYFTTTNQCIYTKRLKHYYITDSSN